MPELMQADVGIALGAGTDIAIEPADIVLVGPSLDGVLDAYHVARNTFAKTVQNVALAFAFSGIGVPEGQAPQNRLSAANSDRECCLPHCELEGEISVDET